MSRREFSARGSHPRGFNRNPRFGAGGRAGFGGSRGSASRGGNRIKYMSVDPRILVKKGNKLEQVAYEPKNKFSDFPFAPIIQENIIRRKYTNPTPIQDQVIPVVMEGRDVIGLAATGTGKTAAFMLPLLNKIMRVKSEKVLIMAPTRELAVQIVEEGGEFARGSGIKYALVIGGVDMRGQIRDLSHKPSLVVGTPGRLKDLWERRALNLSEYQTIVLDEVDRMLDMGFINDMRTLIGALPKQRHGLFFSATMNEKAQILAREFLNNPVTVQIETQHASEAVDQDVVKLNGRSKIEVLHELLIQPGFDKVLVFGRTKHGMERLSKTLSERGFATASIHGNKSQSQRQRALTAFKRNEVKVLLATDVAARGIDIDSVTHVINFELPETYADYIHRIGRTGRADRTGVALTFID